MKISSPRIVHSYLKPRISPEVEEFWAIALNTQSTMIVAECLFRGTVDVCLFHPRDLFRFAYRYNASFLVVAHNHPSGNVEPSPQDRALTRRLAHAARILEVPVVDHLILTRSHYYSFANAGELPGLIDPSLSDQSPD